MSKALEAMTPAELRRKGAKMTHAKRESDEAICSAMMLAAAMIGPDDVGALAERIGVDVKRVEWMYDNLVRNGVFKDGRIHCEWGDEKNGGAAFVCDCCIGLGWLNRVQNG